jgi:Fur family ferric uptake transcriptional regulator
MKLQSYLPSKHKYRMTHQRQVILEEVRRVNTHPTADEVYEMVRKRLPRISLGTVYRNLEILSTSGLILKIGPQSSQMRFDGNTDKHYHIRCVSCGRVEDIQIESLDNAEEGIRGQSDYSILGHTLEFMGLCPDCKKKEDHFHKSVHSGVSEKEAKPREP